MRTPKTLTPTTKTRKNKIIWLYLRRVKTNFFASTCGFAPIHSPTSKVASKERNSIFRWQEFHRKQGSKRGVPFVLELLISLHKESCLAMVTNQSFWGSTTVTLTLWGEAKRQFATKDGKGSQQRSNGEKDPTDWSLPSNSPSLPTLPPKITLCSLMLTRSLSQISRGAPTILKPQSSSWPQRLKKNKHKFHTCTGRSS